MDPEKELISRCLDRDPAAQEFLYRTFAPRMYGVCQRYAKNNTEAQDMFQEGFIRAFRHLKDYLFEGSFEVWLHRVFVTTAINIRRKELRFLSEEISGEEEQLPDSCADAISRLSLQELLQIIGELPTGYRVIFNMYVIEGYSHKEIGKMLGISESTSKSQLWCARRQLRMNILQTGNGNGRAR